MNKNKKININWKGPYFSSTIYDTYPFILSRASTIIPDLIGHTVYVHNGKYFEKVIITVSHVGYKFGEFVPTRVKARYKNRK